MAISKERWAKAKLLFEHGKPLSEIAEETGIDKSTVSKKAKAENWTKNKGANQSNNHRDYGCVYVIRAGATEYYKIGVANDVGHRLKNLQTAHYQELIVVRVFYSEEAYVLEKKIHALFDENRIRGEWFKLSQHDIEMIEGFVYGTK